MIRSRLSVKLILLSALLTGLAVSAVFLAFSFEIRSNTRRLLLEELGRNQRTLLTLQERTLTQLLWTSSLLTESPTLRAAMETYRVEHSGRQAARTELLATIQHETEKVAAGLDKDLLVVTDDRGSVLAASGRRGARPATGEDLSALPAVRRALEVDAPIDASSFGVVRFRGEYFQIGSVPIVLQGFTIGTLTLGERLAETVVEGVREIFDGDIVVATDGEVLSSTLAESVDLSDLRRLATGGSPAGDSGGTVRVGPEEYVAAALPLGAGQNGRLVSLFLLHSVTRATQRASQALLLHFFLYGVLAVVLSAIGAAAASRSVLAPFRAFVRFMQSVAETGRYAS
ncbi:MAG: hypothetical protein L0Y54_06635, partial [Sporichthyaceae bacterium]|nr:hypothetical protein [Sporichthyaceae bacterium]